MSSLFRNLQDASFKADLGKNSTKIFNCLVGQTLGYGISNTCLTDRRISYLCGVRIDRVRPALQAVIAKKLFDRKPSKSYQYRYSIGAEFLEQHGDKPFYTPALPKNGTDFQKTDTISEKERHTALDLNHSFSLLLKPLQTVLTLSVEMMQQQMQQQNQLIAALLGGLSNNSNLSANLNPVTAPALSEQQAQRFEPINFSTVSFEKTQVNSQAPDGSSPVYIAESDLGQVFETPKNTSEPVKENKRGSGDFNKSNTSAESPPVLPNSSSEAETNVVLPLPKAIAASIETEDHAECNVSLSTLSETQQKDLFTVYGDMLDRDVVRFPMQLFKGLTKKAKKNRLTLPKIRHKATAPYPVPPPAEPESDAQKAQREAQEEEEDNHSLRQMLRINSGLKKISVEELAEQLCLTHLLPV